MGKGIGMIMEKSKKRKQTETLKKVLNYIEHYKIFLVLSLFFAVATVASTQIGRAHV